MSVKIAGLAPVPDRARGDEHPAPDLSRSTAELNELKEQLRHGPGLAATHRMHARGRRTVHERLGLLFDPGSFTEINGLRRHSSTAFGLAASRPHGDGVVTGWGTVHGRQVFVYAHDARVFGGTLGKAHADKIQDIIDLATSTGAPIVALCDGAGARIQEGVDALAGYGGIFRRHAQASGVVPQLSVVLGPCAGGAAYAPALTDVIFMVSGTSQLFVTGPDVIRAVTGEEISMEDLGGASAHTARSGVATLAYPDEASCLEDVAYLLSMLPANSLTPAPVRPTADSPGRSTSRLVDLVPADPRASYDVRAVIEEIADDGAFFELQDEWAASVVIGLAHLDGQLTGVVASQPARLAGVLDIDSSDKAARFVRMCDAFGIPLLTLVDVPGFLPGSGQEHAGIIRHGAKLLYAYCTATVPRIQLVLRKAYGGAYIVMDSLSIGADLSFAWPANEIAVMGAEGAANIIFRREIAAADDPDAVRARRLAEYRETLMHPHAAAESGHVHDVIDPARTRETLIRSFRMLRGKRAQLPPRKHGNPPV